MVCEGLGFKINLVFQSLSNYKNTKKNMLPKKVNFMKTRKGSNNETIKKKIQHKKFEKGNGT